MTTYVPWVEPFLAMSPCVPEVVSSSPRCPRGNLPIHICFTDSHPFPDLLPHSLFSQGSPSDHFLHSYHTDCFQGNPDAQKYISKTLLISHALSRPLCIKIPFPKQVKHWLRVWAGSSLKLLLTVWPKISACQGQLIWKKWLRHPESGAKVPRFKSWPWPACYVILGTVLYLCLPSFLLYKMSVLVVLSSEGPRRIEYIHICKALWPVFGPEKALHDVKYELALFANKETRAKGS